MDAFNQKCLNKINFQLNRHIVDINQTKFDINRPFNKKYQQILKQRDTTKSRKLEKVVQSHKSLFLKKVLPACHYCHEEVSDLTKMDEASCKELCPDKNDILESKMTV